MCVGGGGGGGLCTARLLLLPSAVGPVTAAVFFFLVVRLRFLGGEVVPFSVGCADDGFIAVGSFVARAFTGLDVGAASVSVMVLSVLCGDKKVGGNFDRDWHSRVVARR